MLCWAKGNAPRALLLNAALQRSGGALVADSQDGILAAGSVRDFPKQEAGVVLWALCNKMHVGCVLYLNLLGVPRILAGGVCGGRAVCDIRGGQAVRGG